MLSFIDLHASEMHWINGGWTVDNKTDWATFSELSKRYLALVQRSGAEH